MSGLVNAGVLFPGLKGEIFHKFPLNVVRLWGEYKFHTPAVLLGTQELSEDHGADVLVTPGPMLRLHCR